MKRTFFVDAKNKLGHLYGAITKKHLITVTLYVLTFSCVFYLSSKVLSHDEYIAKLTMITLYVPENGQISYSSLAASHSLSDSFSNAYISSEVLQYTINKLDLDYDEASLLKKISVLRKPKTLLVSVTVRDRNEETAVLLCNTIVEGMKKELACLFNINKIIEVEKAEAEIKSSNNRNFALLGAALGFAIYTVTFYIRYYYVKRIWTAGLVRNLNIAYLGTVYND